MPPSAPALERASPVAAGLLLSSRSQAVARGLAQPSVDEILARTGATRSRAYELKAQIDAFVQTLARAPGRPRGALAPAPVGPALVVELLGAAFDFMVRQHPGCVQQRGERARDSDEYRRVVLELRERHPDVAVAAFAAAIRLPLGTLED